MTASTYHGIDGVLCLAGGAGSRLGVPKAWLDWNGEPLLRRVVRRLAPLSNEVVVVARRGQSLPDGQFARVNDTMANGPLAGLAAGLGTFAAHDRDLRVAVVACDYPFASGAVLKSLAARYPHADIALPVRGERTHPLHAVWKAHLSSLCYDLLEAGERRVHAALDACDAQIVDDFADLTIDLDRALQNVNDPESLRQARGEP